jgi:membrane dipeptidase
MSMGTVITHANVRSLRNHPRNAPDDVLAALAGRGGVIGITAYAPFCESSPGQRPGLEHFHPGWK